MLLHGQGAWFCLLLWPHFADTVRPVDQVDEARILAAPLPDDVGNYSTATLAPSSSSFNFEFQLPDPRDVESLHRFVTWYYTWSWFQVVVVALFAFVRSLPAAPIATAAESASLASGSSEDVHWHDDWWSCSDPKSLWMGIACPCVLWADNMHLAGFGTRWSFDLFVCMVLYFSHLLFPAPIMWLAMILVMVGMLVRTRKRIKSKSEIVSGTCQGSLEFVLVLCCYPLTLAQESRHIRHALLVGNPAFVTGEEHAVQKTADETAEEGPAQEESSGEEPIEEEMLGQKRRPQDDLARHGKVKLNKLERKHNLLKKFQEAAERSRKKCEKYCVYLDESMYDAVLVASFGGVGVEEEEDGKTHYLLKPCWLLVCGCLPLFAFQNTLLWCMVIDSDFTAPIDVGTNPHLRLLHVAKLLMVAQLAMMALLEMSRSLQAMLFALNPATGHEFVRHLPEDPVEGDGGTCVMRCWRAGPFGWRVCWVSSALAEGMQLHVAYNVLLLSLSTVLKQGRVHDVLFNGLALLFVLDLDNVWFAFLSKFISIDHSLYETITDDSFFLIATPWVEDGRYRWLSWSSKAGARLASQFITVLALLFIAQRQLMDYYIAVKTNKLPVWRLVCDLYTGQLWSDMPSVIREQAVLYSTPTFLRLQKLIQQDIESSIRKHQNMTNTSNALDPNSSSWFLPGHNYDCYPDFDKQTDAVTTWEGLIHSLNSFVHRSTLPIQEREATDLAVDWGYSTCFIDVGLVVNGLVMVLSMLLMFGSLRSIYK